MLHNVIYTERQTILAVLPSPLIQSKLSPGEHRSHTQHPSQGYEHVWRNGANPDFLLTRVRTQQGTMANTPGQHYPAGYMHLIQQLQDTSLPPSKDCQSLNIKDKEKTWLLGEKKKGTVF